MTQPASVVRGAARCTWIDRYHITRGTARLSTYLPIGRPEAVDPQPVGGTLTLT